MKKCKKCKQVKSKDEFYPQQQRGKNGQVWKYLDPYCKPCRLMYSADRRRNLKKECIKYLGGKCKDCGMKSDIPAIYDFHHNVGEKDFNIGKTSKSFDRLKKELDKCVLLCSNCHRIRHYK